MKSLPFQLTFEQKILSGFGAIALALVLMGFFVFNAFHSYDQAIEARAHSHQTIEAIEFYLDEILNAETGERGYLITGDKSFLDPYNLAQRKVEQHLKTLEQLTQDDPSIQSQISLLKELTTQKKAHLERVIRAYDQQGFEAAQRLVKTKFGKKTMDRIRWVLSEIEQAEMQTLRKRDKEALHYREKSMINGSIFGLSLILLLSLLFLTIKREMRRRLVAERSLKNSVIQFRTLMNSNMVGIFFWDKDEIIQEANDTFLNIIGYERDELLADHLTLKKILPEEYWAIDKEVKNALQTHHSSGSVEKQYIRKDGARVDVLVVFALINDPASLGVTFVLDITEKKRLEAELRKKEAEQYFYHITDLAPILLWIGDLEGNNKYPSKGWLDFTGQTREEGVGFGWGDVVHPEDRKAAFEYVNNAMKAEHNIENTFRVRRHDGQYRWMLNRGIPRRDEHNRIIDYVGFCVDLTEQRESELALRKSERQFLSTFEQAAIGIAHVGLNGHFLRLNQKYCDILCYTHEELLQKRFQDITFPEDLQKDLDLYHKLLNKEITDYSLEKRYLRKDGSVVWVNLTASIVWDEAGNYEYAIAAVEDIMARKEMECDMTGLLKNLSDFKYALDESAIVAITDAQGKITYVNDAFCNISHYSKEELIGQTHQIINSHYHPHAFFEELWQTISAGKVWQGEIRNKTKEGQYYWVNTTIVPFLDSAGIPYQYIAIRSNITAEKKAEEDLLQLTQNLENQVNERTTELTQANMTLKKEFESKELLERQLKDTLGREQVTSRLVQTINQSFDNTFILQKAAEEIGNFMFADRCLIIYYETTPEKILQRLSGQYIRSVGVRMVLEKDIPFDPLQFIVDSPTRAAWHQNIVMDYTSPNAFPDCMKDYTNAYGIQSLLGAEIRYRGKSYGRLILHQCSYQRTWQDQEKSFLEALLPQIGATLYQAELYHQEQKAKEEYNLAKQDAEYANQQKSQVLAFVSHDFKNPLNAILGYSNMLEKGIGGSLPEKQQRYVHNIAVSGRLLLDMVTNVLDVARLEAGQLTLKPEWIRLEPFISDIKSIIQPLAAKKNINFYLKLEKNLEELEADPILFRQVLLNLLSNAIKYNKENGTVILSLFHSEDKQSVVLKVQDTGIGIPEENFPKLFKQFYRVESLQSVSEEGTGLGLASVKQIVELHGGTLSVESSVDVGSVFTVTLPAHILAETSPLHSR